LGSVTNRLTRWRPFGLAAIALPSIRLYAGLGIHGKIHRRGILLPDL